jgi:hypothetical protein
MVFLCIFTSSALPSFSQLQLEWETSTLTNFAISNHIIRLDDQQNIFVAGNDNSDSTDVDVYKFSTSGDLIWHYHYDGDSMLNDAVADLLIDQEGNALLTGYSYERYMEDYDLVLDESYRAYVIKLDLNGEFKRRDARSRKRQAQRLERGELHDRVADAGKRDP